MSKNSNNVPPGSKRSLDTSRIWLYFLILLSGAAGLVYEVVWARQLTLFIGNTATANAAVLTAFMAGLALGSILLGRIADRTTQPLRLYALLEILIGCYGASTPWLFDFMQSGYASIAGTVGVTGPYSHFPRFIIATISMLIPTFLMGGTLPLLVRYFAHRPAESQKVTSQIYGINTLGATVGAFSAGFILLPALGITKTLLVAALVNIIVGLGVYRLLAGRGLITQKSPDALPPQEKAEALTRPSLLLIGFALSGFAALLYQVVWIHSLILVIGVSIYAFSTVLTVFLAGIGLGSLLIGRFYRYRDARHALKIAFYLQLGIAMTATISLTLISQLPVFFVYGWTRLHESFFLFQGYSFLLTTLIILVPTVLLGALFPLVTGIWSHSTGAVGRGVGEAYGANALGTIGGAAIGSLFMLDSLGIENSLYFASAISLLVATIFWFMYRPEKPNRNYWMQVPLAISMVLVVAFILPGWDRQMMQAQVFRQSDRYEGNHIRAAIRNYASKRKFLYYKEGIHGTVSVVSQQTKNGQHKALINNGKIDASNGSDMSTQILLGQLPMFLHEDPREVMLVGLGSGISAGSVLRNDKVESLDLLEISPEVIEASNFFREENFDVLDDSRTNLIVADARNYLLASAKKYDVIISEPSHSWVTGVSNLFTREFLQQTRDHLNENGILVQWYHLYGVDRRSLLALLRSVTDVFPHYTLWYMGGGDIIIVSSKEPPEFDYQKKQAFFKSQKIRADLERANAHSIERLMTNILMSSNETKKILAGQEANTDDKPIVEFNAPRYMYTYTANDNVIMLFDGLVQNEYQLPFTNLVEEQQDWAVIPFMGIKLWHKGGGYSTPTWNVVRTSIEDQKNGKQRLVRGMNGSMVLHRSWGNVVVSTTMAERGKRKKPIHIAMMESEIPMDGQTLAGEMRAPGITIHWRAAPSEQAGKLDLVLVRICERETRFDNWVSVTAPYPGDISKRETVSAALQEVNRLIKCIRY